MWEQLPVSKGESVADLVIGASSFPPTCLSVTHSRPVAESEVFGAGGLGAETIICPVLSAA